MKRHFVQEKNYLVLNHKRLKPHSWSWKCIQTTEIIAKKKKKTSENTKCWKKWTKQFLVCC